MLNTLERAVQHWNMVSPVVDTPSNQEEYELLLNHIEEMMTYVRNSHNVHLAGLLKTMSNAAKEYEQNSLFQVKGNGLLSLRYLVKLHQIKQSDLKEIGSQGVVSEILNGKRALTLRHVRALSKRFNVSPGTFIDH